MAFVWLVCWYRFRFKEGSERVYWGVREGSKGWPSLNPLWTLSEPPLNPLWTKTKNRSKQYHIGSNITVFNLFIFVRDIKEKGVGKSGLLIYKKWIINCFLSYVPKIQFFQNLIRFGFSWSKGISNFNYSFPVRSVILNHFTRYSSLRSRKNNLILFNP